MTFAYAFKRQFQNYKITLNITCFYLFLFFTDGLSWYIQDAAQILSTRIVKKPFIPIDRGEMLIFQNYMHSWVCYECVKILNFFGLQPKIRSDIKNWSTELDALFKFFSDKQGNNNHKKVANEVLDLIINKTAHSAYFQKIKFGSIQKFQHLDKPILYLVIMTWLRQLQEYFFSESNNDVEWNDHGRYWGIKTGCVDNGLGHVHMSKANSQEHTLVEDFSYFTPSKETKPGVILSLEEWAANILEPDIPHLVEDEENFSDETKSRFTRANSPFSFNLSTTNFTKPKPDKDLLKSPSSKNTTTSSDTNISQLSETEKLQSIATVFKNCLASAEKKSNGKRKIGNTIQKELDDLNYGAECFVAFMNDHQKTKFRKIEEVFNHLATTHTANQEEECKLAGTNNNSQQQQALKSNLKSDSTSSDSDSDSNDDHDTDIDDNNSKM